MCNANAKCATRVLAHFTSRTMPTGTSPAYAHHLLTSHGMTKSGREAEESESAGSRQTQPTEWLRRHLSPTPALRDLATHDLPTFWLALAESASKRTSASPSITITVAGRDEEGYLMTFRTFEVRLLLCYSCDANIYINCITNITSHQGSQSSPAMSSTSLQHREGSMT